MKSRNVHLAHLRGWSLLTKRDQAEILCGSRGIEDLDSAELFLLLSKALLSLSFPREVHLPPKIEITKVLE